jgi:predicted esterase
MSTGAPRNCTFTARLDCHYLLEAPEQPAPGTLLLVTMHGFGGNPEEMLRLTEALAGPGHVIASIQGPNQFYLSEKADNVGYGWGTGRDTASSVRLHHEIVQYVLNHAGRETGIPPSHRVLVGFSQPVGLNYRFAATFPEQVRGVIGLCGGVPGDWENGAYWPVTASILHIARSSDVYYPAATAERFPERLRQRARDVEFHMLEGPHRFPSKAAPIAQEWLARLAR